MERRGKHAGEKLDRTFPLPVRLHGAMRKYGGPSFDVHVTNTTSEKVAQVLHVCGTVFNKRLYEF